MSNDRRIDYIEFPVTKMAETKKFYADLFGWEMTDYGPDYASFADGRITGGFRLEPEVTAGGPLVVLYAVNLEEIETRRKWTLRVIVTSMMGATMAFLFSLFKD